MTTTEATKLSLANYFGSWYDIFNEEELLKINNWLKVQDSATLCPLKKDIFKAFSILDPLKVNVVILGQDPYNDLVNGVPRATGLAFANSKNTPDKDLSPSLRKLMESWFMLETDLPFIEQPDPSLKYLEQQGVLLLNSSLTCEINKPLSHQAIWRPFIEEFLYNFSHTYADRYYVLLGKEAQTFKPKIDPMHNSIFELPHPSWYARENKTIPSVVWHDIKDLLKYRNNINLNWIKNENDNPSL